MYDNNIIVLFSVMFVLYTHHSGFNYKTSNYKVKNKMALRVTDHTQSVIQKTLLFFSANTMKAIVLGNLDCY